MKFIWQQPKYWEANYIKILNVIPAYAPAYSYGGPVKTTHDLCGELVRKGHEVWVFTTNRDTRQYLLVPLDEPQEIDGVKIIYHKINFPKFYYYSLSLKNSIKRRISKFDIVHIHSVYSYPTAIAAHWCRKLHKPYILNPFGALDPYMISIKGRIKKYIYLHLIERRNINNARFISVASKYEEDAIHNLGYKTPTIIIPCGIRIEEYEKNERTENIRKKYPLLRDKQIVLFLGRIHEKKGLDTLAYAFKKVSEKNKNIFLLIAGPCENGYLNKIKRLCDSLGILKNIIFTGMLLDADKLSALHNSDIFVLPSRGENFGIAILEAMACGLPVVITDKTGLSKDVKEYGAGIVTDFDVGHIADSMLTLLDDNELRRSMGGNGKKLVKDKFLIDKVADKYIEICKTI